MRSIRGKVAAITGAGSGIGRATAKLFAENGCDLAISDVDERGLEETAQACRSVRVTTTRVDVADRGAVHAWANATSEAHGRVNIIVNNAGVGLGATVDSMEYEDLEWLMGINFWGVVHGTKAFLPLIKRAGEGHVVNISSVFGLIGVPSQSAYCAAKFAVRGFTESLREELLMEGSNVGVTCVHPGGIKTNIARRARMRLDASWGPNDPEKAGDDFERLARTTPEGAARDILDAILNGRPRQLIGADARMIDWMQRLLPQTYQRIVMYAAKKQRERRTT